MRKKFPFWAWSLKTRSLWNIVRNPVIYGQDIVHSRAIKSLGWGNDIILSIKGKRKRIYIFLRKIVSTRFLRDLFLWFVSVFTIHWNNGILEKINSRGAKNIVALQSCLKTTANLWFFSLIFFYPFHPRGDSN